MKVMIQEYATEVGGKQHKVEIFVDGNGRFTAKPFKKELSGTSMLGIKREIDEALWASEARKFKHPDVAFKTLIMRNRKKVVEEVRYVGNDLRGNGQSPKYVDKDGNAVTLAGGYRSAMLVNGDAERIAKAMAALDAAKAEADAAIDEETVEVTVSDTGYSGDPTAKRQIILNNAKRIREGKSAKTKSQEAKKEEVSA